MKRFLSVGLFSTPPAAADDFTTVSTASPPTPPPATAIHAPSPRGRRAPADEYFGRFRMSVLGVRNVIADVDARADSATEDAARRWCHRLILAEDALRDWSTKYPDDTWIPKLGYAMLAEYRKLGTALLDDDANVATVHAIDLETWLTAAYPQPSTPP
jgi:hypothetical protein